MKDICEVCRHPEHAYVEKEILSGRRGIEWGCQKLQVAHDVMWAHIEKHVKMEEDEKFTGTMTEMLDMIINELFTRFQKLVKQDDTSPRDVKACVDAINTCVMNIAKLKRIIAPGSQTQIQTFNTQMERFVEFLHNELPLELQPKVEEFLLSLEQTA